MGNIVLDMSMSLDGFITGPEDNASQALGLDELMATGAVLVGRRTFDHAGGWNGDHHDGVPIFVPTHQAPDDPPSGPAKVTYVDTTTAK